MNPHVGDAWNSVQTEALKLQKGVHYTEKAHFAAAERLRRMHYIIGVIGAVVGAVATATVLVDVPLYAGIAGLVASVAASILTLVNPQATAETHLRAGRRLGALKVKLRQVRTLDTYGNCSIEEAKAQLKKFAEQKADIDSESPPTTERAYRVAVRKSDPNEFSVVSP